MQTVAAFLVCCLACVAHGQDKPVGLEARPSRPQEHARKKAHVDADAGLEAEEHAHTDAEAHVEAEADAYADAGSNAQQVADYLYSRANIPELLPSDFTHNISGFFMQPGVSAKVLYIGAMTIAGIFLIALYHEYGLFTCGAILSYVFALATMSVLIRGVFVTAGFDYPLWVTSTHFVATGCVAFCVLQVKNSRTGEQMQVPTKDTLMYGLLPVATAFAGSIGLGNLGISFTNAHFYEMFSSATMLATVGLGMVLGRPFNMQLLPFICVITFGMLVVASGEVQFSVIGFCCILGCLLGRAGKAQIQSMLLSGDTMMQKLNTLELVIWTSVVCFFIMSTWASLVHGFAPLSQMLEPKIARALLLAAMNATVLNIAALFVLKEVGPVGQQIVGNLKGVLACMGAVAAFGEVLSMQQIVGYVIVISGVFLYNKTDRAIKAAAQKEKEALLPEGEKKV